MSKHKREIELRGPLNKEVAVAINQYAIENNWEIDSYKQVAIYCETSNVDAIGSVETGRARLIIDVRNDIAKLKIKIGNALNIDRKEFTIKTDRSSVHGLVALLQLFGIESGYLRTFDRTDYIVSSDVTLTVKLNCLLGDHYELEDKNGFSTNDIIHHDLIDAFGLHIWTKDELAQAIENDHDKVRAIPLNKIIQEHI